MKKTTTRAASAAPTLDGARIEAALLLKDLRGDDPARAGRAAGRFAILPYLASDDIDAILAKREELRLKHALAVVAAELGYAAWTDCKRRLEPPAADRLDTEAFFPGRWGGAFLNRWFARYAEARASLEAEGGYLFPFRRQFFVCEGGFLEARGIDPEDPDWDAIGRDWIRPLDDPARLRLERRLVALGFGHRPAPG